MKEVLVYFHTHWDREWYKTRVEFNFRLVKVFDDVLNKLSRGDLPSFYFDGQVSALLDYLKFRPENEPLIKKFIKEKKLFIGPFYCSTDSFLVSAQSLLANIDLGIKYSEKFGNNPYIGYCADTFGHSKSLPEIFNYYNFNAGIFWRGLGNLPMCFDWCGLKAIYLRQGYFHDYLNTDFDYTQKAELIETQLKKIDDKSSNILLLPLGADHLKVADNIKEQIKEINKHLSDYKLVLSNPFEYIEAVKPTKKVKGEFRDNSRNFILSGIFSSRIDIKQKNAYSQWKLLRIAEPLNALCFKNKLTKENYQPQIDSAKEELIKNHAHDSIYGCALDDVHKDMLHRFTVANQTSDCVINEILNELETKSDKLSVINLSDYKYSGLCEIVSDKKLPFGQLKDKKLFVDRSLSSDINKIPVTEDFKPIYTYLAEVKDVEPFTVSTVKPIKTDSDIKITNKSIENSKIKFEIKNNKIYVTDKIKNKTMADFIEIVDLADVGDSYNYAPIKNDKKLKAKISGSKILLNGSLRSELKVSLKIDIPEKSTNNGRCKKCASHILTLIVSLDKNSDFLKFRFDWKNKSQNHILKVVFNFEKPVETVISDDLLGDIERKFDYNYDLSKEVPAPRGVELKTNTQCLQTYFNTQDIAVITKGLNEYCVSKNCVELTILRSSDVISNPQNPARGTPAGPPIKTYDLLALGENHAEFALMFANSYAKIKQAQQSYYCCAYAFWGDIEKTLLKTDYEFIDATFDKKPLIRVYDKKKGRLLDL